MKRLFLFLSVLAFQDCFSATGSASDGELAAFAVILVLMLPIVMAYSIPFIKHSIYSFIKRKKHSEHLIKYDGE